MGRFLGAISAALLLFACFVELAKAGAPVALTGAAPSPSSSGTTLTGSVDPNGEETSYWFEYGPSLGYGTTTPSTPVGAGVVAVTAQAELTGLSPATTYNYRLVAQNPGGTSFGTNRQFTTASIPAAMGPVSMPTLRSGRLVQGAVPLGFSWSATPGSGPICRYEVQEGSSTNPPTHESVIETTSLSTTAKPATGLYFRVTARGCDGTVTAFADSPAVNLRLQQESTSALMRGAGWRRLGAADASGGYVLRTTTPGARLALSFTGRSLALVVPKGRRYGAVSIGVDGAPATRVNLYGSRRQAQVAVYVVNFFSSGKHKVVIRARAAGSRRRVEVDAFAVIG